MGDAGTELAQQCNNSEKQAKCAAPCAAVGADFGPLDADLAEVIDAWPTLPDAVRAAVLAMVRGGAGAQ
jgi:hypothetical protein